MSERILVAGTQSSVGKTTVAVGLLAALRRQGVGVAAFKTGPDYIDPGLLSLAAGRPARNLDTWLLDEAALSGVFERGMRHAELAVIEGVMGVFDGIGASQVGSTAALARTLACPVVLVLDVSAMSGTAAALVLGCQRMQPGVQIVGVVLNRVGSDQHARATAEAIHSATSLPVLGTLPADERLVLPERHLGLVPVTEAAISGELLEHLANLVEQRFDLAAIRRMAATAPALRAAPSMAAIERQEVRIAVAQDRAFGFYYQDTFDILAEHGAELVPFSPIEHAELPADIGGVYLGGGFPELYASELAANQAMRAAMQRHARAGLPIYAECGGLMVLGETLTTFDSATLPMFGLLPVASRMSRDALTIGYAEVEALRASPLMPSGARVRGHEFHWSVADPPPRAIAAYQVLGQERLEGFCIGSVLGTYMHLNLAGRPDLAQRLVATCAAAAASRDQRKTIDVHTGAG